MTERMNERKTRLLFFSWWIGIIDSKSCRACHTHRNCTCPRPCQGRSGEGLIRERRKVALGTARGQPASGSLFWNKVAARSQEEQEVGQGLMACSNKQVSGWILWLSGLLLGFSISTRSYDCTTVLVIMPQSRPGGCAL